jgi:hypothetical protein
VLLRAWLSPFQKILSYFGLSGTMSESKRSAEDLKAKFLHLILQSKNPMNRRDLVLVLLAASGGRPYSPAQLQKSIFLISRNMPRLVRGPAFNFVAYDYGPFDSDVYSEAEALRQAGEAVIAPSGIGRWNTYAASDTGLTRGRNLIAALDPPARTYLEQISTWVRAQSFSGLVKSIYDAYPEMRENSIFRG